MDLRELRIFRAVASEGGIARAANALNCVQSNVSTQLRQLETRLGVALFHRVRGRLIITNEGSQLLDYTERILRLVQEAKSVVSGCGQPAGQLRIGSTEATAAVHLPRVLAGFQKQYPKVDLAIETGPVQEIVRAVVNHHLDIAIAPTPTVPDELTRENVFIEKLLLITDHSYQAVLSAEDIRDCCFLSLSPERSNQERFESWLKCSGLKPGNVLEFNTLEVIIACVGAGMGVSLVPRSLIESRDLTGIIKSHAIPADIATIQVHAVWHRKMVQHAARDAFIRDLRAASPSNLPNCTEHSDA